MLVLIGIRVHVKHRERFRRKDAGILIVSNHVSYIDVLVLASLAPSVFITSIELGSTLVLGTLARCGGSLFVERRRAAGLKKEIAKIAHTLTERFVVTLFPEGTTSNGERVQPFKNSLFDAAVEADTDILPVCLRYTKINGEAIGREERDAIFYYGGMSFFRHFGNLLFLKSVEVEVVPLKAITVDAHASRKTLAAEAHAAISGAYHH
jgi:1-acyl-sn-glycerol-3-phosphate acyltransferase